ncbi:MAG: hypothetical protein R2792_14190 [Saprospiraceae bacterium]
MAFNIIRDIGRAFSPDLPNDLGTMDQHLDFIIPKVIPFGEDLREEEFWVGRRWKEVRDDEGFHEAILHIFNGGNEYMLSLDGNVLRGTWRRLEGYNTLILEVGGRSELFDLRFLNGDFMVMTKHGDQGRKGQRKYFCLAHEPVTMSQGRELDWRNIMERLFNVWRDNSISIWAWLLFIVVLAVILWLSVG